MSNEKTNNWKDAPEWATHRTIDANGDLFYHERRPYILTDQWLNSGRYLFCGKLTPPENWSNLIERRPEPQKLNDWESANMENDTDSVYAISAADNEPPQIDQPVNDVWFIFMGFQFHKKSETFIISAMRGVYNYDVEVNAQFIALRDIEKETVTVIHDTEYHGAITQGKVLHTLMLFN